MSFTDQAEDDQLDLWFLNVDAINYGDAAGLQNSAAVGATELAIATAAFVDADTLMTANEVAYTGYVRPTQARDGTGWTSAGGVASNFALEQFGEMSAGGPDTATHVGITFNSATDSLQIHGALDAPLVINNGVNPQFIAGALDYTLD